MTSLFGRLRGYLMRRKYVVGATRTRFLRPDIRREVLLVDVSEVDAGRVLVRVRTYNVLYVAKGLAIVPPFGEPQIIAIRDLWRVAPDSIPPPLARSRGA